MLPRIDTEALKREHPVEHVIARYGIELRHCGRTLVGRCPFHVDGGRPNLTVYPGSRSWYCFRCAVGGDAISFVERMEGVGFREAVTRMLGATLSPVSIRVRPVPRKAGRSARPFRWGPVERACLAAAVELYHNRLLSDPEALAYVEARGLDRATLGGCRVGYASGDELAAYLRWRHLPAQAAVRVGLLRRDGREFLADRVVVPEIRSGQPIWLVGRTISTDDSGPKYLGLPGRKPLLGWETASTERTVWLTEGVFDWLTLRCWGYPALALVGTHARAPALKALARFERVHLVLDNDQAGQAATTELAHALGGRAVPVALHGVKDVAELGACPDGRAAFARALQANDLELAA